MGIFGWDYPPGAEHDPNAPWNQSDPETIECDVCEGTGENEDGFECENCDGEGDIVVDPPDEYDRSDEAYEVKNDK